VLGIIYTASLDTTAKGITAFSLLFAAFACYIAIRSIRRANGRKRTVIIHSISILLFVSINAGCYLYAPEKYVVGNFDIAINRPMGDIVIHVKDILEIRVLKENELEGTSRTFGVGGLFGYYGSYYNKVLGDMKWYATNQNNMVIIRSRQGDAIVISPDDKYFVGRIIAKMQDL
jgi:hypothetical protein